MGPIWCAGERHCSGTVSGPGPDDAGASAGLGGTRPPGCAPRAHGEAAGGGAHGCLSRLRRRCLCYWCHLSD
jgi:hypothetical protein